jgi:ADP-heptose:LPS heptosyltransferase
MGHCPSIDMKVLIVRFSSIGDIVLTTPVIRILKSRPETLVHYVVFRKFSQVLKHNPYIDKVITVDRSIREVIPELRSYDYDLIIDLHRNIRTLSLKLRLLKPFVTFRKLNLRKLLLVVFRLNYMPEVHVVDRYLKTLDKLMLTNDFLGLDYHIADADFHALDQLPPWCNEGYYAIVVGGRYPTKIFPPAKVREVVMQLNKPVVLVGGQEDFGRGAEICEEIPAEKAFNACGRFSLNESAAIIAKASVVLTNDTGLMHIAAAFKKKIVSVWGNTVPALGMTPYLPLHLQHRSVIIQRDDVKCRPCSKLGYDKCPRRHFDCMLNIDPADVASAMHQLEIMPDQR